MRAIRGSEAKGASARIRRAATRFGWEGYKPSLNRGRGFAFARDKNHDAYLALALDIERGHDGAG